MLGAGEGVINRIVNPAPKPLPSTDLQCIAREQYTDKNVAPTSDVSSDGSHKKSVRVLSIRIPKSLLASNRIDGKDKKDSQASNVLPLPSNAEHQMNKLTPSLEENTNIITSKQLNQTAIKNTGYLSPSKIPTYVRHTVKQNLPVVYSPKLSTTPINVNGKTKIPISASKPRADNSTTSGFGSSIDDRTMLAPSKQSDSSVVEPGKLQWSTGILSAEIGGKEKKMISKTRDEKMITENVEPINVKCDNVNEAEKMSNDKSLIFTMRSSPYELPNVKMSNPWCEVSKQPLLTDTAASNEPPEYTEAFLTDLSKPFEIMTFASPVKKMANKIEQDSKPDTVVVETKVTSANLPQDQKPNIIHAPKAVIQNETEKTLSSSSTISSGGRHFYLFFH